MQLTGIRIINQGIVTNYTDADVQQQGVDLRVKEIRRVSLVNCGVIPETGKSIIPDTFFIEPHKKFPDETKEQYVLNPGYYEVEFIEGCNIPRNATLHIKTRSSLVRCGSQCYSGQFDGGFKTDNMGCFLHVILPISIDLGARIAQAIVFESDPVDDEHLYDGQWQGDKQRGK